MKIYKTPSGYASDENGGMKTYADTIKYFKYKAGLYERNVEFYRAVVEFIEKEQEEAELVPLAKQLYDSYWESFDSRDDWDDVVVFDRNEWVRVARVAKEYFND